MSKAALFKPTREQAKITRAQAQLAKAQAVLDAAYKAKVLYARDGHTQMGHITMGVDKRVSIELNDTARSISRITIETLERWIKQAKVAQKKGYI
jgi:hypothetical protein